MAAMAGHSGLNLAERGWQGKGSRGLVGEREQKWTDERQRERERLTCDRFKAAGVVGSEVGIYWGISKPAT